MSVQVADLVANLTGRDDQFLTMMGLADTRVGALGKSTERSIVSIRGLGLAMGVLGVGAIVETSKAAADFQTNIVALAHGAGESVANLASDSKGILAIAGQVGVSADALAKAMYMIDSAGFHGAASLQVLQASAEGAKVGMADQATVANALTTVLNDYHLSASQAAAVTGQMVNTVASGKMHFQDLASNLSKVVPIAEKLNIPFQQVAAALATLTAQGVPASRAATAIQAGLLQMVAPSDRAKSAIAALGIPLQQLQEKLSSGDLYGAMNMFSTAMETNLPASAKKAITNAQKEFASGMDPAKIFPQLEQQLGPQYAAMIGNLVAAFGGVKGGAFALNLIPNMSTFKADIATIGTPVSGLTALLKDWGLVNTTLNQQIDKISAGIGAMAIQVGTVFLPILSRLITNFQPIFTVFTNFVSANPKVVAAFLAISAAIGVATAATFAFGPVLTLITSPVGALIAVGAALYEAWTHDFGGIQEITRAVYSYIQPSLQHIAVAVRDVVDVFKLGGISAAAPVALANAQALLGQLGNWIQGTGLPYLQSHLRGWIDAYWQWITQVYGPLLSAAGNLLGQFGNWITSTAAPRIEAQLGAWATAFSAWIPGATQTFLQQWPGMLNQFLDWIGRAAAPILTKLANWGLQFIAWIAPRLPGIGLELLKILGAITLFIAETAVTIGNKIIVWAVQMTGWVVTHAIPKLNDAWSKFVDALGSLISTEATKLGTQIDKWALAFDNWVGQGMNRLKPQVQRITTDILNWLGDTSHLLYTVGANIIEGLLNGLKSKAGGLKDYMGGLAKNYISKPVTDFLSLLSPSRLFYSHGQNIVQGLINGLQSQHGALGQAMNNLTQVVNPSGGTLRLSGPLGIGGGFGSGFSGGNQPISVHVNANAITVTGLGTPNDADFKDRFAQEVGELVRQLTQAVDASTTPHGQPGVVSRRGSG